MRGGAGAVRRFPFSARNTALGSTDGSDRRRRASLCCWRRTLLGRRSAIVGCCELPGPLLAVLRALIIIILMIRAPLLMMLVCCLWAGFCTWISSLVKVENSYAWGLAGYTALIIIITIHTNRCWRRSLRSNAAVKLSSGIVSAIVADLLFSPRSIKKRSTLSWITC